MSLSRLRSTRARSLTALALLVAGCAIFGGCGTPAVVTPTATPLPGFKRDIQAAHNVVAQTEREAQGAASTSLGSP